MTDLRAQGWVVAEQLGRWRRGYTSARMADGRTEEVPITEQLDVELLGRTTTTQALVLGETVLLGAIVLEGLALAVDCRRKQLLPNLGTRDQPLVRV
ncbi:MAG: hypothetical protein ACREN5_09135 [Gemmatimonadales bacterium]